MMEFDARETLESIKTTCESMAEAEGIMNRTIAGAIVDIVITVAFMRQRKFMGYLAAASFACNVVGNLSAFNDAYDDKKSLEQKLDADCMAIDAYLAYPEVWTSTES